MSNTAKDVCPFSAFGAFVKQLRRRIGFTLQRFCAEFEYEPRIQSKMERGFASPPSGKKMDKLAKALGLWKDSTEWNTLFDFAKQCHGMLPPPGLSDEDLIKQLPLVFRTVHGKVLSEDKMMEFAQDFRSF
jgi:transcriptional regulator with XRE-family HTH domain